MVLTEALVRGLPVVSTTGGAIPHTLPADAALLVPPGDDAALASALGSLLDAEEAPPATAVGKAPGPGAARRAGLAAGARRHASELPDWKAAARTFETQLLALAPDAAGSRSRPAAPAHDDGDRTRT